MKEEGGITLSGKEQSRIKKLFVNLKDNTIPYMIAL